MSVRAVIWVIPCFNEEARLSPAQLAELVVPPHTNALLVNDGSTDGTQALLERLASESKGKIRCIDLEENRGKAEAVRLGLLAAIKDNATFVGYLDADFATPPSEAARLHKIIESQGYHIATGARVLRMGASIERRPARHYFGRVFATVASWALEIPYYDTQCGAKIFRVNEPLVDALEAPFQSRWAFDVELLGRLVDGGTRTTDMIEVPLNAWHHVAGSKLGAKAMLAAGWDLVRLGHQLRRNRRRPRIRSLPE